MNLETISEWSDYLRVNAAIIAGKIKSIQGLRGTTAITEKRAELTKQLYDEVHGTVKLDKRSVEKYLLQHPETIELIQELLMCDQLLMGRQVDQSDLPSSINSYIFIVISSLVGELDLTYGLSNVSDAELEIYMRRYKIGGKKSRKSKMRRKSKRSRKTRKMRRTKRARKY